VVASTNRVEPDRPIRVPDNAVLVDWLRYSQVIPKSSLVICHGGHGTVARALAEGVPVLTCPAAGDMNETAARVTWAGVGLSVRWSLTGPRSLRWAVAEVLEDPAFREKAREVATWSAGQDGAARGSELIETLATV
jgi:UDP:flavonoid glycosyltransferase YjiC (YdhE family)